MGFFLKIYKSAQIVVLILSAELQIHYLNWPSLQVIESDCFFQFHSPNPFSHSLLLIFILEPTSEMQFPKTLLEMFLNFNFKLFKFLLEKQFIKPNL
jgi:hypothetical protein